MTETGDPATVLERVTTPRGELVLRRRADVLEVISNGTFLMDTHDGASERALVDAALDARPQATTLLIGGLGVGFSLLAAVAREHLTRIDVVEIEPALLDWHHRHFRHLTEAALADPRVRVVLTDIRAQLAEAATTAQRYDAICLDVDNGPDWTVTPDNRALYTDHGIAAALRALTPGGVLAVWSASPAPDFEQLMRRHVGDVRRIDVPVRTPRAAPDVVYLGHRRT